MECPACGRSMKGENHWDTHTYRVGGRHSWHGIPHTLYECECGRTWIWRKGKGLARYYPPPEDFPVVDFDPEHAREEHYQARDAHLREDARRELERQQIIDQPPTTYYAVEVVFTSKERAETFAARLRQDGYKTANVVEITTDKEMNTEDV